MLIRYLVVALILMPGVCAVGLRVYGVPKLRTDPIVIPAVLMMCIGVCLLWPLLIVSVICSLPVYVLLKVLEDE